MYTTLLIALLSFLAPVLSAPIPIADLILVEKRQGVDYFDPRARGGSLLNDSSENGGEPLNVIISGKSSSEVLTEKGFLDYARAIGFSRECFGQHEGRLQKANLGDGNGWVEEREVLREHFNLPILGTCLQSLVGGNHLRTWRQNGPLANSGALFLAVSEEHDLGKNHMIIPDGYNIGRDNFVRQALGKKRFLLKTYTTTVEEVKGLLEPGSAGVNHGIAQDGVIKVLTVKVGGLFG